MYGGSNPLPTSKGVIYFGRSRLFAFLHPMNLTLLDWAVIAALFLVSIGIGFWVSRRAGSSSTEFFLSGRNMPWWLLGVSMVATTFSADTPNLVTDIIRNNGIAGNWVWWAFCLTGMLTVFVYAKLWRRSGVFTDLEFYELRYGGKKAAFLRGFRAVYLGVFFNVLIMATVCLAAIKISGVLLGIDPVTTLVVASVVTVIYSALGGLRGVVLTDFVQFIVAMIGAVAAAYVLVNRPEVGGLDALFTHPNVRDSLDFIPDFEQRDLLYTIFILPLAIQWWNVWYPGAEPGGGGYVAQRMLAAKNENHATGATLLFNVAHYALRPWPWILVALCSMVVFPDLASIEKTFPHVDGALIRDDLAYPAMLSYLPEGLLGLVVGSLIAAFMSTISTHLNWGSSYVINDVYVRFFTPQGRAAYDGDAQTEPVPFTPSQENHLVFLGRVTTVVLMILAAALALLLESALGAFNILLQIGAGTGLIFILRWFWWRINAYSEITAMFVSFFVALYFEFVHVDMLGYEALADADRLIWGIVITTVSWVTVTLLTAPTEQWVLERFYKRVRPAAAGWQPVIREALSAQRMQPHQVAAGKLPLEILCVFVASFTVYGLLFAIGYLLYGQYTAMAVAAALAGVGIVLVGILWRNISRVEPTTA